MLNQDTDPFLFLRPDSSVLPYGAARGHVTQEIPSVVTYTKD